MLKSSVHKSFFSKKHSKNFLKWGHDFSVGKWHERRISSSDLHDVEVGWPSSHLDCRNIFASQDNQGLSRKLKSISRAISILFCITLILTLQRHHLPPLHYRQELSIGVSIFQMSNFTVKHLQCFKVSLEIVRLGSIVATEFWDTHMMSSMWVQATVRLK